MLSNKFASSCFGMEKILGRYLTIGTSIKKKRTIVNCCTENNV